MFYSSSQRVQRFGSYELGAIMFWYLMVKKAGEQEKQEFSGIKV